MLPPPSAQAQHSEEALLLQTPVLPLPYMCVSVCTSVSVCMCVCGVQCAQFYVWSFVISLVSSTVPSLGTEKQVQQAKYFNQGHHILSRKRRDRLASDCPSATTQAG